MSYKTVTPVSIFLIFIFCPLLSQENRPFTLDQKPSKQLSEIKSVPPLNLDTISILGVGDIMLGTDYPSSKYLHPSKNCTPILSNVMHLLQDADLTFGNLEGVFAGESGTAKHCNNPDQCYVFRMPVQYAHCLVDAGFDVLSVANNHVNDFGYQGRVNSAKVLDEAGLSFAGFKGKPYTIKEINGIKYGLCAFAPHSGTEDSRNISNIKSVVTKLDSVCDIVIVSFHVGAEGKTHQHVTRKKEIFLGYDRGNIYEIAHVAIDAGADIIFGHGPHVTRALELYKNRLICYSLGNFATYRRFNLSGPNGVAPMVKVFTNKSGEFLKGEVIPIKQLGEGIPHVDPENGAIKKLQELTSTDFPNGEIQIQDNGTLTIKPNN